MIQLAENYCSSLPDIQYGNLSIPSNLESYIDDLFDEYLKEKDMKKQMNKLQKDMLTGICVGTVEKYEKHWWKNPITKKPFLLSELMNFEKGKTLIENFVKQKKDKGEIILNTNISF